MRLLVIRTSAMGDVALTLPVLKEMGEQYPEVEITMVTRESFRPFFNSYHNLDLFIPDFNNRHSGFFGLLRLYKDIRKAHQIDFVIDLHDVLRSVVLRSLFRLSGVPGRKIWKGRKEKRDLITGRHKIWLMHSVERYREVFRRAGFDLKQSEGPWLVPAREDIDNAAARTPFKQRVNIGAAPFTLHKLKLWPVENMAALLNMIRERYDTGIWLFGGKDEMTGLEELRKKVPGSEVVTGKLSLAEEIALMSQLDLMISMDSSNMHMASMVGIKVLSIWGATDPMAGFGAWMQPDGYSLRIPVNVLDCRPCTVFGRGECKWKDHACMEWLTPVMAFKKTEEPGMIKM